MAGARHSHAVTLAEIGEDVLVERLVAKLASGRDLLVGPGDDCAVIGRPRAARWSLLKTDCVIENVHFLPRDAPERIGWKALCRAISDVAAMGGEPAHALITIAAKRTERVARLEGVYAGLRKAADRFDVVIAGGESARSPGPLFINVGLTGTVARERCVLRSGGKAGDAIYVSGRLGGSAAGKHLDFTPRLVEARWLTTHFPISAMMDLSDGLAADLPRLARASGCGFVLDEAAIPRTPGCTLAQALGDGEDYELLFSIAPSRNTRLEKEWRTIFSKIPLTRIGALEHLSTSNSQRSASSRGFDHFS